MDKQRRTIDGLVARDDTPVPRRRTIAAETARRVRPVVVPKRVSVREAAAPTRVPVRRVEAAEETRKGKKIEKFLKEVRDEDPTNLIPHDAGRKEEPRGGRRWVKWVFLIPIVAVLLLAAAMVVMVEAGLWDAQGELMAGNLKGMTVVAAALDIVWNIGELAVLRWVVLAVVVGVIWLAAWKGRKIFGVKKWIVVLVGAVVAVGVVGGIAAWKGAALWGELNNALGNMTGGKVSVGNIQQADPTVPLKEDARGRTGVLVFGTSGWEMDDMERGGSDLFSDSIMVVSLDQDAGDVKTFSLPRDLVLPDKYRCSGRGGINEVYYCEYKKHWADPRYNEVKDVPAELAKLRWEYEERAAAKLVAVVSEVSGQEIHYWAHLDWGALVTVVDAIGGIDIAIEYQGNKDSYTGSLPVIWTTDPRGIKENTFTFAAGTEVHLDGKIALDLARARNYRAGLYGASGSNWNREKNQQAMVGAVLAKAKQTDFASNLDAALEIVKAVGDNLRMSFDAEGIRRGFDLAGKIDVADMKSIDISLLFATGSLLGGRDGQYCDPRTSSGCYSYVWPKSGIFNYSGIQAAIAKGLAASGVEEEGAVVDVLNGTGQAGLAGKVAEELEAAGFSVGEVGNVPEGESDAYEESVIYRAEGVNMSATERKLLQKFGGEVRTGALPAGVESGADFVVVVGEDEARRLGLM